MSKRLCLASCCFFVAIVCLASTPLPQLFQQAKQQFNQASYSEALKTLDEIAQRSSEPENEKYRTGMTAALAFYRGACLAALGRNDEARAAFEIYLGLQPNAQLDPNIYPEKVIATFEETRRGLEKKQLDAHGSIATEYEAFHYSGSQIGPEVREDWAAGPVRNLMTPEDQQAFAQLKDADARREFVTKFWAARDPKPETPENEFRLEFERRVAFADTHFSQDLLPGSLTDRGLVFILLGPPTYVGRQPLRTGDDIDPSGMKRYTANDVAAVQKTIGAGTSRAASSAANAAIDKMVGPANTSPNMSMNWRDVWHYRKELLPKTLGYQQVDFEFITRAGYGDNVLQRDAISLSALDGARKAIQNPGRNGASR